MKQILFVLLLISFNVFAKTIIFTPPTKRMDETPLNRNEISGYEVRTYVKGVLFETFMIGNVTAFDVDYPPGTYGLYMRTIDTESRWSDGTPRFNLEFVIANPNPPVVQ